MFQKIGCTLKDYKMTILISLLCIPIGVAVGAIDALFGRVLLTITAFRSEHPMQLIPFLAIAGAFIAWFYRKFGNGTEKGMGLVFEAAHGETDSIPLRLIPFVTVGTWITHLFGGSAGREGVAVQIGGTPSFWIGKKLKFANSSRVFLIAGMAAGFAGLFRTPIAAVFFALEVLMPGAIVYSALLPSIVSACTASLVSGLLGLEKFSFPLKFNMSLSTTFFGKLILLGVAFGIVGGIFAFALKKLKGFFSRKFQNPVLRSAVIGALLSIALLLLYEGRYAGLGTNLISASFSGEVVYSYDWCAKLIFTVITLSAGFQGGEVTPLFSIGASLGVVLGGMLGLPIELTAALGYAALFGSASNTLLAPMLIGTEVFGFEGLPYFFIVCAMAWLFNYNQSIYGKQKSFDLLASEKNC